MKQYCEELQILKTAIVQYAKNSQQTPDKIISYAIRDISQYRVRDKVKNGWICGTYISHIRNRFRRWLCYFFTKDELIKLIDCCCQETELSLSNQKILFLFLQHTPKTIVHPRTSLYLKNNTL